MRDRDNLAIFNNDGGLLVYQTQFLMHVGFKNCVGGGFVMTDASMKPKCFAGGTILGSLEATRHPIFWPCTESLRQSLIISELQCLCMVFFWEGGKA